MTKTNENLSSVEQAKVAALAEQAKSAANEEAKVPAPVDTSAWRKNLIRTSGIAVNTSKKAIEQDRKEIRDGGGYIPDNAPSEIVTLAATVSRNSKMAARAAREAATALGILEITKAYATLTGPDGKTFKSAKAFYTALFPNMSPKTIASYVNAAKTIYIPALTPDDSPKGQAIAKLSKLEPGTALSACGALNNETSADKFAQYVNNYVEDGGKLTQSAVKELASTARKIADPFAQTISGTTLTDEEAAKAKRETMYANWKATALKCLVIDRADGETHITIPEDRKAEFRALWKSITNEQAGEFMKVLGGIIF